jgi:hypothetical protein
MLKESMKKSIPTKKSNVSQQQARVSLESTDPGADPNNANLIPLEVIRTENVISKFPVHNLAKTGRVNIKLNRRRADGEIEFQWEVSYNEKYGEAKQLAYQIDTLIIARRVYDYFEANLPIPPIIPIGSLYQICQELGMNPQSGKNKNNIKRALGQNAGAFIDAKISYKDRGGEERNLTAQFSRYAVVHRDQKLPDGRQADQLYVVLQPIYLEVLNSARWRPLDFNYLKQLPPASQRCYEIISTRIFAALKYGHQYAYIAYSDYCAFSAQMRHRKYKPFRAQMDHVHKPHLNSGYLTRVEFEEGRDAEGEVDWTIKYYPGPRATSEYSHFNPRFDQGLISEAASSASAGAGKGSEAWKLVEYFHRLSRRAAEGIEPGKKELEQAARLIKQQGLEVARFVVEYAHQEAPRTKFEMQVFGAVLIYLPRALKAYEQSKAIQAAEAKSKGKATESLSEIETLNKARQRYEQMADRERLERSASARSMLEAALEVDTRDWDEGFWQEVIQAQVFADIAEEILAKSRR